MANKSISQLTAGGAVSGTDLFPDVQTAGVGPVKVTATQLATFFWYQPTLVNPSLGAATATSINIGGATLGSNVLAVNGTTLLGGATTVSTGGLTIGVAGTTGGTIALKGSTAGTLTLQVPATVTDYSITLPSAVAAGNGYILTSTTGGVTSWTNPTSLGIDLDVGTTAITNGTVGRVLFEGTGNVLQESANLFWDNTNARLGIGTSSPSTQLHVYGASSTVSIEASSGLGAIEIGGPTGAYIDLKSPFSDDYDFRFVTDGSTYGNVIAGGGCYLSLYANNLEKLRITTTGTVNIVGAGTAGSTQAVSFSGSAPAGSMTLDASGNLGVGTTTPQGRIHAFSATSTTTLSIQGSLSAGANTPILDFTGDNGGSPLYSYGARIQAVRDVAVGGYALTFGTTTDNAAESSAPTERMRIDRSGNVLVGGTAARGTTVGAAHLDIFNGTAPVGTLTNGISLYSSSGDFYFMDAAGSGYQVGYRNIPQNSQSGAYVAVAGDNGKHISITTGGVTVNASVFSAGDVFTIYNNSGSSQNITAGSGVTFRLSGTATSGTPRTVAQYGLATVLCVTGGASPVFVLSGAGVA